MKKQLNYFQSMKLNIVNCCPTSVLKSFSSGGVSSYWQYHTITQPLHFKKRLIHMTSDIELSLFEKSKNGE